MPISRINQHWQKPPRGSRLNRTHPLAIDLTGAWLLNEGTGTSVYDIVNNTEATTDLIWESNNRGFVLSGDSAGANPDTSGISFPDSDAIFGTWRDLTVAIIYIPLTDLNSEVHNLGLKTGAVNPDTWDIRWLGNENTSFRIFDTTNVLDTDVQITNGIENNAGDRILVIGSFDNSSKLVTHRIIKNNSSTVNSATFGQPVSATLPDRANQAHSIDIGDTITGSIEFFAFWKKVLTETECIRLYHETYSFVESPTRIILFSDEETSSSSSYSSSSSSKSSSSKSSSSSSSKSSSSKSSSSKSSSSKSSSSKSSSSASSSSKSSSSGSSSSSKSSSSLSSSSSLRISLSSSSKSSSSFSSSSSSHDIVDLSPKLISASTPTFDVGTVISQIVQLNEPKTVDKISLNLTVINDSFTNFVIGKDSFVSFQAANFREGRNLWTFQPINHWELSGTPETSGTTIQNTLQNDDYLSSFDASINAPYLKYNLLFETEGVYQLWGRGYTSTGVYWNFDDDTTDMRQLQLGLTPNSLEWTQFGQFYTKGGIHTFSVYLGSVGSVILDQWYFTLETDFQETLIYSNGNDPVTLSKSPFNTALRIRGLNSGNFDNNNEINITSWLSSKEIIASGKFNYIIQSQQDQTGLTFNDGLSLEYWQIGGNSKYFAAWDFSFASTSIGNSMISKNFGQNFKNT